MICPVLEGASASTQPEAGHTEMQRTRIMQFQKVYAGWHEHRLSQSQAADILGVWAKKTVVASVAVHITLASQALAHTFYRSAV